MESNYHDLLIEVATNVRNISEKIDKIEKKIDNQEEKLLKKLSFKQFFTIISLIITLIFGAIGYNYKVNLEQEGKINKGHSHIEHPINIEVTADK